MKTIDRLIAFFAVVGGADRHPLRIHIGRARGGGGGGGGPHSTRDWAVCPKRLCPRSAHPYPLEPTHVAFLCGLGQEHRQLGHKVVTVTTITTEPYRKDFRLRLRL